MSTRASVIGDELIAEQGAERKRRQAAQLAEARKKKRRGGSGHGDVTKAKQGSDRLRPRRPRTTDLRHRKRHHPRCGRRREAPRRRSLSHRSRTGRAARRGDGVGGLDRDRRGALHCTTRSAAAWAGGARHRKRSLRKSAKNAHCPGQPGETRPAVAKAGEWIFFLDPRI